MTPHKASAYGSVATSDDGSELDRLQELLSWRLS